METPSVRHGYTTGAQGNRLHYLDYGGEGTTLICMHGVIGNAWNWKAVADGIRNQRRVVALDFRGYGESQWSAGHDYTTSDHVADLAAVIESLGEDSVDLMGSSWGALVAIEYAAENPDRVGQIVVVDVEASFAQSETDLFPRPTSHADHADVRTGLGFGFPNAPEEMLELTALTSFQPVDGGRLAPKHDPYFFERWPFRSDDHWERLDGLETPTLLVHAADSFVNFDVMAEMAGRMGNATLVEVKNSTHVIPVDNPDGLVEVLGSFL
ncbi:MAG: alpha/beta hydrolase [Acidimicrobiia bacterium]|nr:alpha/beta hydrolase [Acidimicrobiia bacterium]